MCGGGFWWVCGGKERVFYNKKTVENGRESRKQLLTGVIALLFRGLHELIELLFRGLPRLVEL